MERSFHCLIWYELLIPLYLILSSWGLLLRETGKDEGMESKYNSVLCGL